jgi:hypothetical protein
MRVSLGRSGAVALVIVGLLGGAERLARAADPSMSECLAANESSIALRNQHKLGQARDQALVCASVSCPDVVGAKCKKRVTDLLAAIPTVVFVAKDGAGHDLVAVKVAMDGKPIADRLDGTAISVDPGAHSFSFAYAGQPVVEQSFVINEGQKDRREVIAIGPRASVAPVAVSTSAGELSPDAKARARTQHVAGILIGATGVVGLGLGAIFAGLAASQWSTAKSECAGQPKSCTTGNSATNGFQDEQSASSKATVATVGFIAGGALVAGGLAVYLTAPKATTGNLELAPSAGPRGTGMLLRGTF